MWGTKFFILFMVPWVAVAAPSAAVNDDHPLPGKNFFKGLPEDGDIKKIIFLFSFFLSLFYMYIHFYLPTRIEQPDYLSFELGRGYLIKTESKEPRDAIDGDLLFPDALDIPDELVEKFEVKKISVWCNSLAGENLTTVTILIIIIIIIIIIESYYVGIIVNRDR